MKCVANLVSDALPRVKEMGLLTVSLLEIWASRMDELAEDGMFKPIVEAVRDALMNLELLPTDDGTFISARHAKLASAEWLRGLLREGHLRELFKTDKSFKWISGDITERGKHDLWRYIRDQLKVEEITPDSFARKVDESFFTNQPDEWMISFYKCLTNQKALWKRSSGSWESPGPLRSKPFIRLQTGFHVRPFRDDSSPNAYLTGDRDTETALPLVKTEISQHPEVYEFLKELGLPELDIVAEVIERILPKYTSGPLTVSIDHHQRDIGKIVRAYSTDSQDKKRRLKEKLRTTPFVLSNGFALQSVVYRRPAECYLRNQELLEYFDGNKNIGFVSPDYDAAVLEILKDLGTNENIRISCKSKPGSKEDVPLSEERSRYRLGRKGFDPNIEVDGLDHALGNISVLKSNIIWNKIAVQYSQCIKGTILRSSRRDFSPMAGLSEEKASISAFGRMLMDSAWLPGPDEDFHKPTDLSLDALPKAFIRDEKLAEQLGMQKDLVAELAQVAGIPAGIIEYLRQNPDEIQRLEKVISAKKDKPAFPKKASSNPERRVERLSEQLIDAPEKEYEQHDRSVRTTRDAINPDVWLRNEYTNDDDQMICQMCEEEMPFRKRDGEYYFEAVEALSRNYFPKEHEAQFLALCPLCAAIYKEFVKRDDGAMEVLKTELLNSEQLEVPLCLEGRKISLRFVERHYHDIKMILETRQ